MHPSLRVIAPLLATTMLAAACFDFDATSAGGAITSPGPDASLPDASHPPDANAPEDASDGSTEAGNFSDGGAFCATFQRPDGGLFFCDDFDEHALPGSWNTFGETAGTLTITDAGASSKPNSLDETTVPLDGGQVIDVSLRTPLGLPALPATLRFAYALQPLQIDTTAAAAIVLSAVDFLDGAGNRYSVGLAINVSSGAPALALSEQSGFTDGGTSFVNHPLPPAEPLAMNAWSDIVVEIDWTAGATAQAIVTINGTQELNVALTLTVVPTSLQIGVGASYVSQPSPVWELRYDDVVFTAK